MSERHAQEALDIAIERLAAERALADNLYAAGEEVEKEWIVRGDGGCSLRERAKFSAALARYRKAREQ